MTLRDSLQEQCVLIVGSLGGISGGLAGCALASGAKVVAGGWTESERTCVSKSPHPRLIGTLYFEPLIWSEDGIDELFDRGIGRVGKIDVVIQMMDWSAARVTCRLLDTDLAEWNGVLANSLRLPFLVARRSVEAFLAQGHGGRILFVVGRPPSFADHLSFAAVESALVAFVRSIAKEYGRNAVLCNMLWTDLPTQMQENGSRLSDSLAETAMFLMGPGAGYINGEVLSLTAYKNSNQM